MACVTLRVEAAGCAFCVPGRCRRHLCVHHDNAIFSRDDTRVGVALDAAGVEAGADPPKTAALSAGSAAEAKPAMSPTAARGAPRG
jgi:hypothetical protein